MKPEVNKGKLVFFIVGSTLLITFVFYGYQICYTPNILLERDDRPFIIRSGSTFRQVQEELGNNDFVNDMVSFSFMARLKGYDKAIKPGRFILKRDMSNLQALKVLSSVQQVPVKITFSYVRLRSELVDKVTKNVSMSPDEFNIALDEFVKSNDQGFTKDNILCMFLPNTYEVYFNVLPKDLVIKLNGEYKKFWNDDRLNKAKAIALT